MHQGLHSAPVIGRLFLWHLERDDLCGSKCRTARAVVATPSTPARNVQALPALRDRIARPRFGTARRRARRKRSHTPGRCHRRPSRPQCAGPFHSSGSPVDPPQGAAGAIPGLVGTCSGPPAMSAAGAAGADLWGDCGGPCRNITNAAGILSKRSGRLLDERIHGPDAGRGAAWVD
jgi:hypothetical protein